MKATSTTLNIHASKRNGAATDLRVINALPQAVELFWINTENEPKSYGQIPAGGERSMGTFEGHAWLVKSLLGAPIATFEGAADPLVIEIDGPAHRPEAKPNSAGLSPDGKWRVFIRDRNVMLRDTRNDAVTPLTTDGTEQHPYTGSAQWSPDSAFFVVSTCVMPTPRVVKIIQSSPPDQLQPKVIEHPYTKPGDPLPAPHPVVFSLKERQHHEVDATLFATPFTESSEIRVRWSPRSDEFFFDHNQRGHQLYRIIGVNAQTGQARTVVEETSKTFIDYTHKTWRQWLDKTGEFLWMSERDGWCHLWLYDAKTGQPKRQVTQGHWVVRSVEQVDEEHHQIWFMASGLRANEDPYHEHLCRVNFDGTGLIQLTEGDGTHKVTFSPNHQYFIDTWSRVDQPPTTELRRSDTGKLVLALEHADASALLATGWRFPERLVSRGRDGKTDIHGILILPSNFEPAKKYPVVEQVYAGPHSAFVPKEFGLLTTQHSIAELGFIVVQVDGMGTNHRGKAFHDVCWKNLADAGFPDRIAWIQAAAKSRPWMDLSRVGIYGGSAGGQSAMRALLDHHDFYSVAVADCGCHDNRMDKIWWNEQWLGWPIDDSYTRNSNVADAAKLEGHLMLAVGELDSNVDPATTMQVVNALEKAGKDFDLVVMTNTGHGSLETPYGSRRRMDFLVRHLWHTEPRW